MFGGKKLIESLEETAPKQFDVLMYLYRVRGAIAEQIVFSVWNVPSHSSSYDSTRRSVYQILSKLTEKRLVKRTSRDFKEGGVYYLTAFGYDEMIAYLDLQPSYIGKGFNKDNGYFDYSLATPTLINIDHFLKQVDVFNTYQVLEKNYPGVFDYRDNRYAATAYKLSNEGKAKFRSDGEIKVLDELYELEVDRATERGEALVNKFSGYNRYFQWLTKNNMPLPKGIIVIIPNRGKRFQNQLVNASEQVRFQSFYQAYTSTCKDFVDKVDLLVTELRHFESRLQLMIPNTRLEFERNALSYFKSFSTNTKPVAIGEVVGYKIAVVKRGQESHYYFVINGEGYQSEPWGKFFKVYQKFKREHKHVFLVLYFSTFYPVPPLKGFDLQQVRDIEERRFYEHTYSVDLGASTPIWYNSNREILEQPPFSD
ncbi:replication-relaxation family protein (plasmid) [Sporosarcina psychrophila]|uniref:replication-relaxation family protein n=1 Tax=Sporosarcina psychrophila TaxID=1476 RepID=UPI0030CC1255